MYIDKTRAYKQSSLRTSKASHTTQSDWSNKVRYCNMRENKKLLSFLQTDNYTRLILSIAFTSMHGRRKELVIETNI